jgi:mannitol-specific phosphotransferase system IIBC component
MKLAVNVKHWNLILVIGFVIPSIGAYIAYTFIAQIFLETALYNSMTDLLSMPSFYLIQFLCIGGMFSVDFFLFSI